MWSIALGLFWAVGLDRHQHGNNLQSMGLKELQKREELDEPDNGGSDEAEKPAREPSERGPGVMARRSRTASLNFASMLLLPGMLAPLESIQFQTNITVPYS